MNSPIPAQRRRREDAQDVQAALTRDFVFEALEPVSNDVDAARLCLANDNDVGAHYHIKRAIECVKSAALTFRELKNLERVLPEKAA
jgi:hypothetical protein